ncbi:MAG: hypothetical protein KIS74_03080 [Burkholderiales bacterium]|nr:hypothetical protein [Burkholderiales bacterium]
MRRVLVEVSTRSGRSLRKVAREPFALTLWVWGELQEMDREQNVARLGERIDLASLVSVAVLDPKQLQKAEMRYYRQAGVLAQMFDDARKRGAAVHEALQKRGK